MTIVEMSVQAALVIIAVTVVRAVALNKLPKIIFLVLWGIILIRLLVPVSFPGSLYIEPLAAVSAAPFLIELPPAALEFVPALGESAPLTARGRVFHVIQFIWLLGALAALSFFAVVLFRSYRKLRFALPAEDDGFLRQWLARNKLFRPIDIMQSDRVTSPLAVGVIHPKIILPKSMDLSDRQLLNHVLIHEYCHIKRWDAIYKICLAAALCLHWFNPLVWVMFALANRDLELTCDEIVVRHFGMETKEAYAYSIIDMIEERSRFAPFFSGFTKNATEERIESIMKIKRASIPSWGIAAALVVALTAGAFGIDVSPYTNARNTRHDAPENQQQVIPVSRAIEIAFSLIGPGTISETRLFSDAGLDPVYHFVVDSDAAKYEVFIDAINGNMLGFKALEVRQAPLSRGDVSSGSTVNIPPSPAAPPPRSINPPISRAAAIDIAYAHLRSLGIPATFRRDSGIDWERGRWVWELEFRHGRIDYEFYIDVNTGAIVKFEIDD